MNADYFVKAKGKFSLRVQLALKPLEMYGQKPFVDYALSVVKILNELSIYEATGENPPKPLLKKLHEWEASVNSTNP